jgi:hypothetical protein
MCVLYLLFVAPVLGCVPCLQVVVSAFGCGFCSTIAVVTVYSVALYNDICDRSILGLSKKVMF